MDPTMKAQVTLSLRPQLGVSENQGYRILRGPYDKDPTTYLKLPNPAFL